MDDPIVQITRSLSSALGVPVRPFTELGPELRRAARMQLDHREVPVVDVELDGAAFVACRFHRQRDAVIVAGPLAANPGTSGEYERVHAALAFAAPGLESMLNDRRARLELANQLELVSSSVVAVSAELDLHTVLRRIVDLARELGGARYAALGVPDASGELVEFVTSGLSPEEEAAIGAHPHGRGILGLTLHDARTIRLVDLNAHPAAVGFPPRHPVMRSFLGVPIVARGQILGNLYLTEKRTGREFSDADAQLIELLARHAAVAIENARLYGILAAQQARLEALVGQFPEAIMIAEPDPPRVVLTNRTVSELLGFEVETPVLWSKLFASNPRFDPTGRPATFDDSSLVRALRDGESVVHREVRIVRSDNTSVTVLLNASPIIGPTGAIIAAVVVFQDITRMKDADQLKDDFLSLVSHELRTPLTAIQGSGTLLDREWDRLDDATRRELLADIAGESRRLGDLIDNMVQLSNIRAGRLKLETMPIQLKRLAERAVAGVRRSAETHEFHVDIAPDVVAEADPRSVDQVLRNLLQNASKYSPPDLPIDVRAEEAAGTVVVSVRDYGPGIDEEDIPFVFERFRRGERARTSGAPGLGLGLYLSRHLVEANHGRIWAERPQDGGSRFSFTLPAVDDDETDPSNI